LTRAVHGEDLQRGGELGGGLGRVSQRLGGDAKQVCGWLEELVMVWLGEWRSMVFDSSLEAEMVVVARFCGFRNTGAEREEVGLGLCA